MPDIETRTALQLIQKDLELPAGSINIKSSPEMEELHQYLTGAINELLDTNFNKLLNSLYRIDISEQKVAEILQFDDAEKIAPKLATLIIQRELQKVYTRMKYSDHGKKDQL